MKIDGVLVAWFNPDLAVWATGVTGTAGRERRVGLEIPQFFLRHRFQRLGRIENLLLIFGGKISDGRQSVFYFIVTHRGKAYSAKPPTVKLAPSPVRVKLAATQGRPLRSFASS